MLLLDGKWLAYLLVGMLHTNASPTRLDTLSPELIDRIMRPLEWVDVCAVQQVCKFLHGAASRQALKKKTMYIQSAPFHSQETLKQNMPRFMNLAGQGILGDNHQQVWAIENVLMEESHVYEKWMKTIQSKFRLIPEMYHVCIRVIRESSSRVAQERAAEFLRFLYTKGIHLKGISMFFINSHVDTDDLIAPVALVQSELSRELLVAVDKNQLERIEQLIHTPGLDVNENHPFQHGESVTPLFLAVRNARVDIIKLLLGAPGIDVNKLTGFGSETALMMATVLGHVEIIKLLLDSPGSDVNKVSKMGMTALMMAAALNRFQSAEVLIQAPGIDMNIESDEGQMTALSYASVWNSPQVMEVLLKRAGIRKDHDVREIVINKDESK